MRHINMDLQQLLSDQSWPVHITELFLLYEEAGTKEHPTAGALDAKHVAIGDATQPPSPTEDGKRDAEWVETGSDQRCLDLPKRITEQLERRDNQEVDEKAETTPDTTSYVIDNLRAVTRSVGDIPSPTGGSHSLVPFRSPRLPKDIEAVLGLLAASSALPIPRLSDLWQYRIQLSSVLACEFHQISAPDDAQNARVAFELSSVVTLLEGPTEEGSLALRKLALTLDSELEQPEHWHEVAEKYGKALLGLGSPQEVKPAYLIVFRRDGKVYGMTGSILGYERAFKDFVRRMKANAQDTEPIHLEALANILVKKFERWHGKTDLDEAIAYYRLCARATDTWHPKYADRIVRLANALQLRAILRMRTADVDEALRLLQQTQMLVPTLSAQGTSRYRSTLSLVKFASWAINKDSIPYDNVINEFLRVSKDRLVDAAFLNNVSHYMRILLLDPRPDAPEHLNVLHDLTRVFGTVLTAMALDNPTRVTFWKLAADLNLWLYNKTGAAGYGVSALSMYKSLCKNKLANAETRIHAAYYSASVQLAQGEGAEAAYKDIIEAYQLIPEAVSKGLARPDQLLILKRLCYIPSFAAAVALTAGAPAETALRLLEQGRSVIWDHLLDHKEMAPLAKLQKTDTTLAKQYIYLRNKIEGPKASALQGQLIDLDARHYASRLQNLTAKIRAKNGFQDFLQLPVDATELTKLGSKGPVVAINVSINRSDALIISRHGITSLLLPDVTSEVCDEYIRAFRLALAQITVSQLKAANMLSPILKWLWKAIVEPVLIHLEIFPSSPATMSPPRIWWLTTGAMNILPLHAAGDHQRASRTGEACTLLDRTISSYVPTLRALKFARERQHAFVDSIATKEKPQALLVPVPKTPNMADLKHAEREAETIRDILTNEMMHVDIQVQTLRQTRCKDILDALQSSTIAHFACHAKLNEEDPSKSQLRLQDWGSCPLEVSMLMELDLSHCQLVYLSACETAVSKDLELRDEGIHISGGFQMAGVPNTIATWWEIEDRYPVYTAMGFYKDLIRGGFLDTTRCATSLREAILAMRSLGFDPLVWGAYVHFGA